MKKVLKDYITVSLKKRGNEYYQAIFSKYDIDEDKKLENIPIWEFLEIWRIN